MNKTLESFLKELAKLTVDYEIEISGCGCCGSPVLHQMVGEELLEHENLEFDESNGTYRVREEKFKF